MIDEVPEGGVDITLNMVLAMALIFGMAVASLYATRSTVDNCATMREAGIITTVEHYEAGCP